MAEKKPTNREQIKQIVAGIEGSIQELFQSERYLEYLRTMSRFHTYSLNNTILIHTQMPNATHVAGFNKWKNQFGRHVKKGEKGLTIIAPTPFKKKIEEMKLDPDTKAPVLDEDGNTIMEEREVEIPLFRPVKVFDVSQTEGAPLPSLVSNLTGNVQHHKAFMEALRRTSPVSISFKDMSPEINGFFSLDKRTISIREGLSQIQMVSTIVHEIAHATLHDREQTRLTTVAGDTSKEAPKPKDRNTKEVEAESVSYAVCQYYGIDTSAKSMGYIVTWSKDKSLPELKASLDTISKTASALITTIDRHFADVCKERGIDLTAQQPEQDVPDTLELFAADLYDYMDQLYQAGTLEHPFTQDPREQSISDLIAEMRKGYLESIRSPLNHLVERMDLTQAKAMLERLDKLIQAQNVPVADLPDTPERFMGDVLDLMDRLYAAGQIDKNFPPENREQLKAKLVRDLGTNPTTVRAVLEKFVQDGTGAEEAGELLVRLDKLTRYAYKMEPNLRTVDINDQHFIQVYERTGNGTFAPGQVLFFGAPDRCAGLLERLQSGKLGPDAFVQTSEARMSRYTTKDGAELDVFMGADHKVYIGRRDHYDNRGHYLDDDKSLLYLSDNKTMFDFISRISFYTSQAELLAEGKFTEEEYAEFDALRLGALAQFEQVEPLLFDGKPFQFSRTEVLPVEQVADLAQGPDQKYDYAVKYEDSAHQFMLTVRPKVGSPRLSWAIFLGDESTCNDLLEKLRAGTLRFDDFRPVTKAIVSHYITKDGAQLVAFTDEDDRVYLGRRENYDHWGHYLDHDNSLLHVSDNWKMFNFISGGGYSVSQSSLIAQEALTQEDFAEYEALRVGVLAQFEQVEPLLFAGEPFHPEHEEVLPVEQLEALYLLDGTTYLHIEINDGGWDYTFYDKAAQREQDGGVMEARDLENAREKILAYHGLAPAKIEQVSVELVSKLRDAADHAAQTAVETIQEQHEARMDELREHFSQEDAALWDTKLDEYPVPNDSLTLDDLIEDSDLLPLSREQAAVFLEQDMTVYMVEAGKEPAMVFAPDDIMELPEGMMLAIPREEWEQNPDFRRAVLDRMRHQEEREQAFLEHGADCFAIYQVRDDDALRDIRFESLDWLKSKGRTVERANYDLVYTAPLPAADSADAALDRLWYQFNNEHPADFQHPSMSVSDIIAIKRDGVVSFHYCDSVGFVEMPDFLTLKPTVAELEAQVKAGQTISLADLADAVHREKGQKRSLVAQLKNQPQPERKKTAPKKSAEKEI